jgi:hypothetical protein
VYLFHVGCYVSFWVFLNNFFLHDAGFCAARSSFIFTYACTWCPGVFCWGAVLNYYDVTIISMKDGYVFNFPTCFYSIWASELVCSIAGIFSTWSSAWENQQSCKCPVHRGTVLALPPSLGWLPSQLLVNTIISWEISVGSIVAS